MADLSQVEFALAQAVQAIVYPNGTSQPSIVGKLVTVERGWPVPGALDRMLLGGNAKITVFSEPNSTRNVTRYSPQAIFYPGTPMMAASSASGSATFTGHPSAAHIIGVLIGGSSGQAYAYRCGPADTLATAVAALAAMIPGATAAGGVITIQTSQDIVARVAVDGTSIAELRRQEQVIRIIIWAADDVLRDQLASAIDAAFANGHWLLITNDKPVEIRYRGTASIDGGENANLYRRDLTYSAEYATTLVSSVPSVIFGVTNELPVNGQANVIIS